MARTHRRIRQIALSPEAFRGLMRVIGISIVLLACAQPVRAQITVSSDIWIDADGFADDGNFWMYGRGMARSDAGWVTVTADLRNPSGGSLDLVADLGTGTAVADVGYQLHVDTAPQGEFSTLATGEDEEQYVGCQLAFVNITMFTANYEKTGESAESCSYWRCGGGDCSSASGNRTLFPKSVCPQFAKFAVLRADYYVFNVCFFTAPIGVPSCSS